MKFCDIIIPLDSHKIYTYTRSWSSTSIKQATADRIDTYDAALKKKDQDKMLNLKKHTKEY